MKKMFEKVAAFAMALVMMASAGDGLLGLRVVGAGNEGTVKLTDTDGNNSINVLAGGKIPILITPPAGMGEVIGESMNVKFIPTTGSSIDITNDSAKNPFEKYDSGTKIINVKKEISDGSGGIVPATGDYEIDLNLYATRDSGNVTETIPEVKNPDGTILSPGGTFGGTFTTNVQDNKISASSTFQFKCKTASDTTLPSFEITADGTGIFEDYKMGDTIATLTSDKKNEVKMRLVSHDVSGNVKHEMEVTFTTTQPTGIIKDTEYKLNYTKKVTSTMIVQIRDPQGMVDGIADQIGAEGTIGKILEFDEGTTDTRDMVVSNHFKLLMKPTGYQDATVKYRWYWIPYEEGSPDPNYEQKREILAINNDRPQDAGNGMIHVSVLPLDKKVDGYLYGEVDYLPIGGTKVSSRPKNPDGTPLFDEIDDLPKTKNGLENLIAQSPGLVLRVIKLGIMGKGDPPSVVQTIKWANKNDPVDGTNIVDSEGKNPVLQNTMQMDYYKDNLKKEKPNDLYYKFKGYLRSGTQNKECSRVQVRSSNEEAITFFYYNSNSQATEYKFGDDLKFPTQGTDKKIEYEIRANKPGDSGLLETDLTFDFYASTLDKPFMSYTTKFTITDSSPNSNTKLSELNMYAYKENANLIKQFISMFSATTGGEIFEGFVFDKNQFVYPSPSEGKAQLELRSTVDKITFKPACDNYGQTINVEAFTTKDNKPIIAKKEMKTGEYTDDIPLVLREPVKIVFTITAEDGVTEGTYTITVVRKPPSEISTLKNIQAFKSAEPEAEEFVLDPVFNEKTNKYEIRGVPYGMEKILIKATPTDEGATVTEITSDIDGDNTPVDKATNSRMVPLRYEETGGAANNVTKVTITTVAEDGVSTSTYTVYVYKDPPNANAGLAELIITNEKGDVPYTLDPAFSPGAEPDSAPDTESYSYTIKVPYEGEKAKIQAKPVYAGAKMILRQGTTDTELKPSTASKPVKIEYATEQAPNYEIDVVVTAEDGRKTKTYKLQFVRTPPSKDATLSALKAADKDGKDIPIPEFDKETKDYSIEVPYTTDKIVLTPTPTYAKITKMTVNGKTVEVGKASSAIKLAYPDKTTISVEVTAEDGTTTMTYTLTVKRKTPGKDSRLKSLVATGTVNPKLDPIFVPSKLAYKATVAEGQKGVTITAVTSDKLATLTINGEKAVSGQATPLIEIVEVQQTIDIVVTAEDGKSTTTYTITFTNDNLIEKSNNADLKSLKVAKGEMAPGFKASTTTYEVYVDEKTSDVDIFPVPADSLAKVQVFAATKEIGDNNGNYSQSIVDGENAFSVKVTSPDGKITKEYAVNVYRNEEGKMGSLEPLHADEIDYEASDIITVDITKRPRIAADVFEELKAYPEKKLVLQGNDYALQFDAKDLTKIIPSEQIYDFGMSFSSPKEDEILSEISSYSGNVGLNPVFLEFNYHGELPAKATFTISLGTKYASRKLYFHYYNEERGRIDYYGYVQTNSKGTFSTSLDRLGTFIITESRRLAGSENKALGSDTQAEGEDLGKTDDVTQNKINPNTGVRTEAN